ncbi:hypothetical protein JS530_03350 [Bifidobacterium sp. LC6]|uniref:Uncharacterized protein n=1 Tax=Bifidobacterium colobi TaxID=2809026 RepID=A0ABS5UU71_9BIFI|nr:hypothetical protein [Bifidobacterium colobi]
MSNTTMLEAQNIAVTIGLSDFSNTDTDTPAHMEKHAPTDISHTAISRLCHTMWYRQRLLHINDISMPTTAGTTGTQGDEPAEVTERVVMHAATTANSTATINATLSRSRCVDSLYSPCMYASF